MKKNLYITVLLASLALTVSAQAGWYSYSAVFAQKAFQAVSKKMLERPVLFIPLVLGVLGTGWLAKRLMCPVVDPAKVANPFVIAFYNHAHGKCIVRFESWRVSESSMPVLVSKSIEVSEQFEDFRFYRGYLESAPDAVKNAWNKFAAPSCKENRAGMHVA